MNSLSTGFGRAWAWLIALPRWVQIVGGIVLIGIIGVVIVHVTSGGATTTDTSIPSVTLESIGAFGDTSNGVDVLGTVQSISQADILAQSGGTVETVNTTLGASVPAGFVIASLDGSSASASVLQAQGGYDAAVAAAKATTLQAQNTTSSLPDAATAARNTYTSAYTTLQGVFADDIDQFFGDNTPVGPALLINPLTTGDTFPRERRDFDTTLSNWQASLATADVTDPLTLLSNAQTWLTSVSTFLTNLADLANTQGSAATPAQLAALAAAQGSVNSLLAQVTSARVAYNNAQTAAEVSQTQSSNSTGDGVTSAQATVEEALGALRAAQAAYEKTVIRAPIAGTVNFLPIHVGDYVTMQEKVATVARNNALEVVMELSQDDANRLAVGDTLTIDGTYKGVVTTIAPALDPTTKEIEVHVAVNDGSDLTNGQSVQVTLPTLPTDAKNAVASTTASAQTGNASSTPAEIELPLTAVKLLPNERDVFTVDSTNHLVAHPVDIGQVIGDRIQITTPLSPSLDIVVDARGLSAGDAVQISTSTPLTDDSSDGTDGDD